MGDCAITNVYMKLNVLKELSKSENATITKTMFIDKVEKVAKGLPEPQRGALLKEKDKILMCIKNGTNEFLVEHVGDSIHDEMISFDITFAPNATGGRRSKARRTKKGKRKGKTAKKRGHRRS